MHSDRSRGHHTVGPGNASRTAERLPRQAGRNPSRPPRPTLPGATLRFGPGLSATDFKSCAAPFTAPSRLKPSPLLLPEPNPRDRSTDAATRSRATSTGRHSQSLAFAAEGICFGRRLPLGSSSVVDPHLHLMTAHAPSVKSTRALPVRAGLSRPPTAPARAAVTPSVCPQKSPLPFHSTTKSTLSF